MKDPYQTLGISRGASDEEVKKAYRAQCKRWHPDLNPGDASAEERFKDIQAAYDAITKGEADAPQNGGYGGGYGSGYGGAYSGGNPYQRSYGQQGSYNQNSYTYDPFGFGFGGFGGAGQGSAGSASYDSTDTNELKAARNYIINGQYSQARHVLDSVQRKNARWYYLSALAYNGLGQSVNALQDARMAVQMDPSNSDYRTLLSQLQNPGQNYYQRSATYRPGAGGNTCWRTMLFCYLLQCCIGGSGGCFFPMLFCH